MPRRVKAPAPRLVDPRNRVALTKEVLRTLGVQAGDYVTFQVAEDGTVYLRKMLLSIAPFQNRGEPLRNPRSRLTEGT